MLFPIAQNAKISQNLVIYFCNAYMYKFQMSLNIFGINSMQHKHFSCFLAYYLCNILFTDSQCT